MYLRGFKHLYTLFSLSLIYFVFAMFSFFLTSLFPSTHSRTHWKNFKIRTQKDDQERHWNESIWKEKAHGCRISSSVMHGFGSFELIDQGKNWSYFTFFPLLRIRICHPALKPSIQLLEDETVFPTIPCRQCTLQYDKSNEEHGSKVLLMSRQKRFLNDPDEHVLNKHKDYLLHISPHDKLLRKIDVKPAFIIFISISCSFLGCKKQHVICTGEYHPISTFSNPWYSSFPWNLPHLSLSSS